MYFGEIKTPTAKKPATRQELSPEQAETLKKARLIIEAQAKRRHKNMRIAGISFAIVLAVAVGIGGYAYWHTHRNASTIADPFTNSDVSSVSFPLYYPTKLPTGFHIDPKSTNSPQNGVFVFDAVGPNNAKLYFSEEARSSTFSLGNFYKSFGSLKEIGVSDGAIAVGTLNNGHTEVVSRANNKTWILCNTTAKIPRQQLIDMLMSIRTS